MITLVETLDFYDQPILFVGNDNIGLSYIAVLLNEEESTYVSTKISESRLEEFSCDKIDLRSLFSEPEEKIFFIIEHAGGDNFRILETLSEIGEDFLPDF